MDQRERAFVGQRRAGILAIAAAVPVALLLWLAIAYLAPPLSSMESLGAGWCLH